MPDKTLTCLNRRSFLGSAAAACVSSIGILNLSCGEKKKRQPNIIFIMADDLGYGDLGCYGQRMIQTPNIDRMAAEGMRFTDFYAGGTVCAPSRCCLLTGMHTGHARIRGNKEVPLRKEDITFAELLKAAGYTTGGVGKWGMGNEGTSGEPNLKGFDYWLGYLDRGHAHNYYPDFLWENRKKLVLDGKTYSHDLFTNEALSFIRNEQADPFFLYLAYTIPHADNEFGWETGNGMRVPSDKPYSDRNWPQIEKNFAAMITRMDGDMGKILELLVNLGIDRETIVFFTSDNGPHCEGGSARTFFPEGEGVQNAHDPLFFDSNGPFRGIKRDLYEGGIRVPMIVRWPGNVESGSLCSEPLAFWDMLPTLAELAGTTPPDDLDGISFLPSLRGKVQHYHEYLYWEDYDSGILCAVRKGNWKAVRLDPDWSSELYDLELDPGECNNLASRYPEILDDLKAIMKCAHVEPDDVNWFKRRRKKP